MIRLIKYLIYLSILTALILFFTPLNLYYQYLEKDLRPVKLEGISGSIIKGQSEKISYMGMDLGQAEWLAYPNSWKSLLVELKVEDQDYDIRADIEQNLRRQNFKNVRGTLDWNVIKKYANFNRGEISGYLSLDFSEISIQEGVPERMNGSIETGELKLISPLKKDLGTIKVDFNSDSPGFIVGTVNSDSHVLNVSGAIYIHKNHRWEVKLNIIPKPGEYELEYALQGIGNPRPGGGRSFNLAGFY